MDTGTENRFLVAFGIIDDLMMISGDDTRLVQTMLHVIDR